jgi:rRNA biogenesis protein RRP5
MTKLHQKPRNINFKKNAKNFNKQKQKKPEFKPKPLPVETKTTSVIKKTFAKAEITKTSSKLPGIQNFWQVEEKPAVTKRSADSDDDSSKNQKKQRLTGAERYQRYIDEEERVRKIEDELADPDHDPHTPDQFERALMKDRNSSFVWIKYMAFHLETAETEKARAVAKKAIASINFREEGELLNVWTALLNLEIRYGNDETYAETLREAVQRNDPFKVYSKTLTILMDVEKTEEANNIIETLKKKFKPLPEMWLMVSEAYLKMNNEKIAKELLPKSLLSLKEKDREFEAFPLIP